MTGPCSQLPFLLGREAGNSAKTSGIFQGTAAGLCLWLAASLALAQVAGPRTWPETGRDMWYWVQQKNDVTPEQISAVFKIAVDEGLVFLDPGFSSTIFYARDIRLMKGKAGQRKQYPDLPAKADDIRIETEWRTGYMGQYRGTSFCYIALAAVRGLDMHYLPDLRVRFPEAPPGGNWNVNIYAQAPYNLFFKTEDTARNFINAVASALKQRSMGIPFSRFGLMWDNVTPAQALDAGKAHGENVLITTVAIAGPADQAGIRPLDIVLEINGTKVKNFSHFSLLLDGIGAGTRASLLLLRRLKDPNQYPEQNTWNTLTVEMEAR